MSAILSNKKGVIVLGDAFNMRHPPMASTVKTLGSAFSGGGSEGLEVVINLTHIKSIYFFNF
ncbi:hypothetical protein YC2023_025852 [Brassica napus]